MAFVPWGFDSPLAHQREQMIAGSFGCGRKVRASQSRMPGNARSGVTLRKTQQKANRLTALGPWGKDERVG